MKYRRHSHAAALSLAISLRDWKSRTLLLLLVFFSVMLLGLGRSNNAAVQSGRNALTDLVAPAVHFLAQPVQSLQALGAEWQKWQQAYIQNEQLRTENAQLKQWQTAALELQAENKSLRDLLHLAPVNAPHYLSGKVQGTLAGAFSRSQFLNIGSNDGVIKNMAVISGDGLVGRILETGHSNARIMLLTDINSRVAVVGQKSREKAVAAGRNGHLLELRYLPQKSRLQPGELLLTSGDAGLLPAGIPVGRVVKVTAQQVLVKPVVDWARLSYVSLIAE